MFKEESLQIKEILNNLDTSLIEDVLDDDLHANSELLKYMIPAFNWKVNYLFIRDFK